MYICAGGRLFVPETLARGAVRLAPSGAVSQSLTAGTFAEQGQRSCTDAGPGGFLSGVPGPAGAAIAPATATGGGLTAASITGVILGVGVGTAAGIAAFTNGSFPSCAATGCNTNPIAPSPSTP